MRHLFAVTVAIFSAILASAGAKPHAVIVVGTHHYSPNKSMPLFAAELERLGFTTTLVNPDWDPEKDKRGLPGIEALGKADVAIFFTRFLKLDDAQFAPIRAYLESGKPVVGLRTSTHGFNYPADHPRQGWNDGFGRDALGTPYLIHLIGSTKIKPIAAKARHPILTGVGEGEWTSPGTLYLTKLQPGAEPLIVGTGNSKRTGEVKNQFGTHKLEKTMTDTVAWTWENKWGGRTFTSSLGHTRDFAVPQSMRVMVNGVFWAAGQEVPAASAEVKTFTLTAKKKAKKKQAAVSSDKPSLAGSRPNIVVVLTDDQGMGDLSCMGNKVVKTLHIDKFYAGAARLADFQASPTCAPTRAAMMSGGAPFKAGVTHTILQRERMAPDIFTLPEALKSAGYATGLFGKWHLGDQGAYLPQNRGFDEVLMHGAGGIGQTRHGDFPANEDNLYFDNVLLHNDTVVRTKGFCTDLFFEAGLAWIREQSATKDPYFAYISLNAPHAPLVAPEKYTTRFSDLGYDKGTAGRYGMVENIDANFGRLMEKLEAWKQLDNTLVIFMTDNGGTHLSGKLHGERVRHFNADLRGGKNSPYEGGTHVPCFLQWGDRLGKGIDIDQLTAHLDLYPTFCALAGVKLPEKMQPLEGRSLLPLLENPKADWPDRNLFFHCGRWNPGKRDEAIFEKCAVRSEEWRLVNNEALYHVQSDPSETKDVAAENPKVVAELQKAFRVWWDSTEPLLVNEGLPKIAVDEQPLALRYNKQLAEKGIPEWAPKSLD